MFKLNVDVFQFEADGVGGVVLSLYSVILSRKIEG